MALFKILIDSHMSASVPELTSVSVCSISLPYSVTVASAEGSISKLKLIITYLRSTMAQERLDGLLAI